MTMENQFENSKRKRLSKACTFCNKRKIRCDGRNPCGECKLRNQRCLYSNKLIKRGPKRGQKWQNRSSTNEFIPSPSRSLTVVHDDNDYDELVLSSSTISYLITIFWQNIHPIWPMFACFSGIEDLLKLSYEEPLLFNVILAITAKTQAHPSNSHKHIQTNNTKPIINQEQVTKLINQSKKSIKENQLPLKIESIQILVLMSLSELGGGDHEFAFHYSAKASLMTIEMGLYKIHHDDDEKQENQKLNLKSTFWCVYILDKLLSIMLGKPMLLRKSDFNHKPNFINSSKTSPNFEFLREGDSHLFIYQEYVKLILILQDIIEEVYAQSATHKRSQSFDGLGESYLNSVKNIQSKLQEWKQDLPLWIEEQWQGKQIKTIKNTFLLQSITLEAWYHACLLLLNRPLFGSQQDQNSIQFVNKEDVQKGHSIVCQSAKSITKCLKFYQETISARCIPSSWIFLTFLSAVIHITCIHNDDHDSNKILTTTHRICFDDCINLLIEISQTWKHAGKQIDNLYVISNQINSGQSVMPTTLKPFNHQQPTRRNDLQSTPIEQAVLHTPQKMEGEIDIDKLWNDLLVSFEPGDAVLG